VSALFSFICIQYLLIICILNRCFYGNRSYPQDYNIKIPSSSELCQNECEYENVKERRSRSAHTSIHKKNFKFILIAFSVFQEKFSFSLFLFFYFFVFCFCLFRRKNLKFKPQHSTFSLSLTAVCFLCTPAYIHYLKK
jgi:hypothetical protein